MSYIGKQPEFTQYPSKFFDGDGSAMTVTLDYAPPNDAALLVFIDGVRQDTSAYNCTGTSCVFTGSVPSGTNNVQVVHMGMILDVGVPGDDTVTTVKIQDDAVTADKLANSINTEITANTAKVTNATHTGDVTGATALTIAADAVDIAMLSATGTASATTFLRGDNAWASAAAGLNSVQTFTTGGNWTRPSGVTKVIMEVQGAGGSGSKHSSEADYSNTGSGGGYAKKFLDVSSISTSTITVGSGGPAASSNGNGNAGGLSSWADGTNTITGSGGLGGTSDSATGGTASGGDVNVAGGPSTYKENGGFSFFSPGPIKRYTSGGTATATPSYGGGGMGAYNATSGAGANGIVIVWEYK